MSLCLACDKSRVISAVIDGESVSIRVNPARKEIPAFAYVSGPGTATLMLKLSDTPKYVDKSDAPPGFFVPELPGNISDENSIWLTEGDKLHQRLNLPRPIIVVTEPPGPDAPRSKKLEWNSTVVHEWQHYYYLDFTEYNSFRAQDRYLESVGLPPRFSSDEEHFQFLRDHPLYGPDVEARARLESIRPYLNQAELPPRPKRKAVTIDQVLQAANYNEMESESPVSKPAPTWQRLIGAIWSPLVDTEEYARRMFIYGR